MKTPSYEELKNVGGGLYINPIHIDRSLVGFNIKPANEDGQFFCDGFFLAATEKKAVIKVLGNNLVISHNSEQKKFRLFPEEVLHMKSEIKKMVLK